MAKINKGKIGVFCDGLMHWHNTINNRQMPWKGEKDPYKIWLSEIILQQTRVEQGRAYYEKFIRHYPTVEHLANANDDDVFKLWEGLGYYSRCKNLLHTARNIVQQFNGQFPNTYEEIIQLKGIGPYTAAAIASFAFNLPHAVVDGNVYRVLARYFGIDTPSDTTEGKKLFTSLAQGCIDSNNPALYNQAIMDFGATVCTPANVQCHNCSLKNGCAAFAKNLVAILPVKVKQLQKKDRWFTYFIIEKDGQVLIGKRTGKDIWQNLYEFFLTESLVETNWTKANISTHLKNELGINSTTSNISEIFTQKLTHQTIFARFIQVKVKSAFTPPEGFIFHPSAKLSTLPFPKTITAFLDKGFAATT